ncbi:Pyruvate kinase [Phytophthora fragariae]|uniref:Pyruvate kinase n=1 Tax=Phytophthora fragariae TaxID=53985 RepID=A0A6A3DXZ3_9STRA|nr:Pyruvate kinase [Phytophthora fragariae]KAE9076473.1 Pyruvate kinase [Phytophthora fragariae]KAE9179390.1 Pyruvate kinase [Phytophthora fragariae]KAE9186084.1 Pyruvate kinase [Phytophthora fragariae]KAE9320367.1 Pyruvate kinase [Phytophthora fragariae]
MAKKGEQLTEDHQGPRHILAERAMSTPEEGMQATPLMVMFGLACAAQAGMGSRPRLDLMARSTRIASSMRAKLNRSAQDPHRRNHHHQHASKRAMSGALGLSQQGVELESIMRSVEGVERKTRIVCTLGPSCWSEEGLGELIDAGMNVARFNFSHGDHTSHAETLNRLRAVLATRPHKNIAIMLDTKGPEIRTGFLANKDKVTIKKGSTLELTTDYEFLGDETKIACSYPELPQSVKVGGSILVADGSLVLTVTEIKEDGVVTQANNTATLGERKNMNLPGCKVMLPTLTEKDEDDLVNFGLVHGIDYIAASFVRTGQDIDNIREVLGPRGRSIKIIAKIESQEGLENFDEILAKTDGIMVARGDLGMEIPPEKVFLAQKMMIRKANIAGKPVVTATQMLESMIKAPRPTRAECTDVANAVLDGTDAVMLSGETANGDYPTEAVSMMSKICVQAEGAIHYNELYQALHNSVLDTYGQMDTQEAITSSAVKTAIDINAKMIVVLTESGNTARLVSKFRPSMPVLVLTALGGTARQAEGFYKGVTARCMGSMIGTDSILFRATDLGKQFGWVKSGDNVVALHGMVEARSGSTNMLKVLTVE